MKKLNMPLIIGGLILAAILIVMIFPELLTDNNPYSMQYMRFLYTDNQLSVEVAPFEPSSDFPLGSDDKGRDIYSNIIYGTRLTILMGVLIALGRFIIAVPPCRN